MVKKVVRRPECVIVSYEREGKLHDIRAKRLVMTLSLPLAGKIEFVPGLSHERRGLIAESEMGRVNKIIIAFKRPWWREQGLSGEFISDAGPLALGYDRCYEPDGFYGLVVFCAAKRAAEWDKKVNIDYGFTFHRQISLTVILKDQATTHGRMLEPAPSRV